jgi:hypothetical protein
VNDAIAREKQLKGWDRQKKVALIELLNPDWDDLSAGWYGVNPKVGVGLSTDGQSSQAGA